MNKSNHLNCVLVHTGICRYPSLIELNLKALSTSGVFDKVIFISDFSDTCFQVKGVTEVSVKFLTTTFPEQKLWWDKTFVSKLESKFLNGFWLHTVNRFFFLYLFAIYAGESNFFHIENDYYLSPDLSRDKLMSIFDGLADSASCTYDSSKGIAAVLAYCSHRALLPILEQAILRPELNDMQLLQLLKGINIRPLGLEREVRGEVNFDPNFLGQFIFGDDAVSARIRGDYRNNRQFFLNESSTFKLNAIDLIFGRKSGRFSLGLRTNDERIVPVHGLHIHAKTGFPWRIRLTDEAQIISGERIQSKADVTVCTPNSIKRLKRQTQQPRKVIILSTDGVLGRDAVRQLVEILEKIKTIFVYGDEVGVVVDRLRPYISAKSILYVHNSDAEIDPSSKIGRALSDCHELERIYCQNLLSESEKFKGLPIGIANSQWRHGDTSIVERFNRNHEKSKLIYINFSRETHHSRISCWESLKKFRDKYGQSAVCLPYHDYICDLANHKFAACPRGNGRDTHRFWESIYVGTIPIVLRKDYLPVYEGYPVFYIDTWDELTEDLLEGSFVSLFTSENYLRIPMLSDYF
jgi:hypothetical protein